MPESIDRKGIRLIGECVGIGRGSFGGVDVAIDLGGHLAQLSIKRWDGPLAGFPMQLGHRYAVNVVEVVEEPAPAAPPA